MWNIGVVLLIIDIIICIGVIGLLLYASKNKETPKLEDNEYEEFIDWYKKNKLNKKK